MALANGDSLWERQSPPDGLLTGLAAGGDGSLVYAIAQEENGASFLPSQWRLVALDSLRGDVVWRGPSRTTQAGARPPAPVVAGDYLFVQAPPSGFGPWKGGERGGKGVLEAYQRR